MQIHACAWTHTHIPMCIPSLTHTHRKIHMQRQKKKHTHCRAYTIMTFGESVNMEFLTMATLRSTHEIIPRWHSLQHFPACPIFLIWLEGLLQQSLQKQVGRKSRSVCAGREAREKEVKRGGRISGGQINELPLQPGHFCVSLTAEMHLAKQIRNRALLLPGSPLQSGES